LAKIHLDFENGSQAGELGVKCWLGLACPRTILYGPNACQAFTNPVPKRGGGLKAERRGRKSRAYHAKIDPNGGWGMPWEDRITADPKIQVGKPIIRGTRISVEFILDLLASRWSEQQILENYPHLTFEDIAAFLHYAKELVKSERVYPVGS